MNKRVSCEHLELSSKYTVLKYYVDDREVLLRVQSWVCPECGTHGAETEIVNQGERAISTAS